MGMQLTHVAAVMFYSLEWPVDVIFQNSIQFDPYSSLPTEI